VLWLWGEIYSEPDPISKKNSLKYLGEIAKGRAKKYTEL
jgi:hypothetical protein